MKTIKKRLNRYTKNILIGWGSCLFLEFTFVFFTSNIQSPLYLGLERQIVHSDNLCRTNSQCILIIENQKVCMYYQRITSLFRGFFSLKQIFCQVTGEDDFNFINI
jgi:hypothetical protein